MGQHNRDYFPTAVCEACNLSSSPYAVLSCLQSLLVSGRRANPPAVVLTLGQYRTKLAVDFRKGHYKLLQNRCSVQSGVYFGEYYT